MISGVSFPAHLYHIHPSHYYIIRCPVPLVFLDILGLEKILRHRYHHHQISKLTSLSLPIEEKNLVHPYFILNVFKQDTNIRILYLAVKFLTSLPFCCLFHPIFFLSFLLFCFLRRGPGNEVKSSRAVLFTLSALPSNIYLFCYARHIHDKKNSEKFSKTFSSVILAKKADRRTFE